MMKRRDFLTRTAATIVGTALVPAALRASEIEAIRSAGKVVAAINTASPSWSFIENGEHVGFNKEILIRIVEKLGVPAEEIDLPFQGMLAGLQAGQFDMIADDITITEERSKLYAITRPIAT